MIMAVEITLTDTVSDLVPGIIIKHESAKHGLLGFNGVRWDLKVLNRVSRRCFDALYHG
jgi:hypothetical protein